jgi:hypothetical protein
MGLQDGWSMLFSLLLLIMHLQIPITNVIRWINVDECLELKSFSLSLLSFVKPCEEIRGKASKVHAAAIGCNQRMLFVDNLGVEIAR